MATNTYVALDKITVSGTSTNTVTFTSIPQGYTDLVLVVSGSLYGGANRTSFVIQLGNGSIDTGTNYSSTWVAGNGTTTVSSRYSNGTNLLTGHISEAMGTTIVQFMNYANTSVYKTVLARGNSLGQVGSFDVGAFASLWRSTSAINTMKIYPNDGSFYNSGTTFSLYGIAAQTTPGTAKATGGTITYDSFGRVVHTFTSSGTFTPTAALTNVDYLVIAGGGGSGTTRGGGGGAGGLRSTVSATGGGGSLETPLTLSNGTAYTVTVGAGGAGSASGSGLRGDNGSTSSIAGSGITTISSTGGGGGGGNSSDLNGANGGSGGGGRQNSASNGGFGIINQGYTGGGSASSAGGGGGGGAGAIGSSGTVTNNIGAGGAGVAVAITGTSTYYAGGGAGGGEDGRTASGGVGGGGNTATAGTANTGGGAGGPNTDTASSPGFNGGSGIVIIRYQG